MKTCTKCKETKLLDSFNKCSSRKDGLQTSCRECSNENSKIWFVNCPSRKERNEKTKQWQKDNPEKVSDLYRSWLIKTRYGLTQEQYDTVLKSQNGLCAICGTDDPGSNRKNWCVDHDHKTGRIRGLLCNNCNRGIGLLKEDLFVFESAMVYLRSVV